ncbi:zinc carboxypeptidase-like [Culex pipiens pallens]|uniref:zinc carboxypeptidase-like n=1 Tax=Culex pipiens pallens TaxID=42434 RepID=UPI00195421D1|nr:zinc carboxypeptidase-like [Culex pipiens pallens]
MKLVIPLFAVLLAATSVALAEKARFDNYRLYRIQIDSVQDLEVLQAIEQLREGYTFWAEPVQLNSHADLVVPPHKFAEFGELVERHGLRAELTVTDLQKLFDDEQRKSKREGFEWENYHHLEEIYAWLDELLGQYPDVLTPITAGNSYEGRPIRGVKVSYKAGNAGVIMEGTIHSREWISCATVTWILNQLLTSTDPQIRNIAENYDWHFFPVANPDGYVYTRTTNRAWRKTRKPHNILCVGADPNRNWDYKFMQGGASSNPCTDTFAGPEPFSEDETRGLSQYITSVASTVSTYLDFHAYSQLLMLPYGHTPEHLDNYDEMLEVAKKAADKLKERYGTEYKVGNIAEIIYIASGSSLDWVKGNYQTPIAFAYELRDTGRYGFVLPPEQIVPTAEETLDSVIVILEEGERLGLHQPFAEAAAKKAANRLE